MAKLVKKDTFLYEPVNPHGDVVRRQVFAGQFVPDHYIEGDDTDSGAFEEVEAQSGPGLGAGQAVYPHQRGVSAEEQLRRRGVEDPSDEEVAAATYGGQAAVDAGMAQDREHMASRSPRGARKSKVRTQSEDPGDDRPRQDDGDDE
jgi:hypothetical protein